jgi:hypothetical protein
VTAGDLITADRQIEWRSTLLGVGTPYGFQKLEGWLSDLPSMRGEDFDRPGRHGQFPGASEMSKRTITYSFLIATTLDQLDAAVAELRAATAPAEVPVEEPLVIRIGGVSWMAQARVKRRTVTVGVDDQVGYATGAIQWDATDPRCYSPAENSLSTALASPSAGGLAFNLVFPLDFGSGPVGGFLTATNNGTVATWPTFEIRGPVAAPVITNHATGERLTFSSALTVATGQVLTLDTDQRQVTLNGVSAADKLMTRSWFPLLPGQATRVDFTAGSYDPAASLTVRWRDATA